MTNFYVLAVALLVVIARCGTASAQIAPSVGVDHLITYHKNPFSYLYFHSLYLTNDEREVILSHLAVDSMLEVSPNDIIRVDQKVLQPDELDSVDLLIYKKPNERIEILQVLVETDSFVIVCERIVADSCDCGSYVSLFLPQDKVLINIERLFSFSLRKDFARTLAQHTKVTMDPDDFENLCEMINALKTSDN